MNSICKELFRAIHEGRWVSIEYKNKEEEITKYWIGIKAIDVKNRMLTVDGLHLSRYTSCKLCIFIDSILSASVVDGSYCPVNEALLRDIRINPHKYQTLFGNVANLKILNYLSDCNRMDTVPYECDYSLLGNFDEDKPEEREYGITGCQGTGCQSTGCESTGHRNQKRFYRVSPNGSAV